jgi:hypothetical protein
MRVNPPLALTRDLRLDDLWHTFKSTRAVRLVPGTTRNLLAPEGVAMAGLRTSSEEKWISHGLAMLRKMPMSKRQDGK